VARGGPGADQDPQPAQAPPLPCHKKCLYLWGDRVRLDNSRISHSVSYDSEVRLRTNHAHKYPALGPAYQSIPAWPSLWGCFFGTLPMDPMCHCLTIAGIIFSGRDKDQAEIAAQVYETLPPPPLLAQEYPDAPRGGGGGGLPPEIEGARRRYVRGDEHWLSVCSPATSVYTSGIS